MSEIYTVTMAGTYFVSAYDEKQAQDYVSEALLGRGNLNILKLRETHWAESTVQKGFHSTIEIDE